MRKRNLAKALTLLLVMGIAVTGCGENVDIDTKKTNKEDFGSNFADVFTGHVYA